jgi:hypothetical protein
MSEKVELVEGEEIAFQIKAKVSHGVNNPIIKAIDKIIGNLWKYLLGYSKKGYLTVTNKRVIITSQETILWCVENGKLVKTITPQSIKEIGYTMDKTFCCFCPLYVLYYEGVTDEFKVYLPDNNEKEVAEYAAKFYEAVAR